MLIQSLFTPADRGEFCETLARREDPTSLDQASNLMPWCNSINCWSILLPRNLTSYWAKRHRLLALACLQVRLSRTWQSISINATNICSATQQDHEITWKCDGSKHLVFISRKYCDRICYWCRLPLADYVGCCLLLVGRITNRLAFEISAANLSSTSFQRQKRLQKRLRWNQPKACQALEADQACLQFGDTILECNRWTADASTNRHPRFLSFFMARMKEI